MVKIPTRLEELLPAAAVEKVLNALSQPDIPASVRDALGKLGWKDANPLGQVQEAWQQARSWLESVTNTGAKTDRNVAVLNGTGSLFSAHFDAVPQATTVAYGYSKSATSFQDAANLKEKSRELSQSLFSKSSTWVHSPSTALRSLTSLPQAKGGFVVSRADAVRVPGFGDVRAMLTSWSGSIEEVGAANGASQQDWEQVLTRDKMLLLVSPNNLSTTGAAQQREAAVGVARKVGACVVELLIDGIASRDQDNPLGFPEVTRRLEQGAQLVLLPTHLLLAGPTGMFVIGDDALVKGVDQQIAAMGEQMTGPTLASACLALQLSTLSSNRESGIASLLHANTDNLKSRARRLAIQLNDTPYIRDAVEVERDTPLGPTPWDRYQLKNWGVRLTPRQSVEQLKRMLEADHGTASTKLPVAVVATPTEIIIDLRFIAPEDDHEIVIACGSQPSGEGESGDLPVT